MKTVRIVLWVENCPLMLGKEFNNIDRPIVGEGIWIHDLGYPRYARVSSVNRDLEEDSAVAMCEAKSTTDLALTMIRTSGWKLDHKPGFTMQDPTVKAAYVELSEMRDQFRAEATAANV